MALINGTSDPDLLIAALHPDGSDGDVIFGLGGNDLIYGSSGRDQIDGGSGDDRVQAGGGGDTVSGGTGNDDLHGGDDADTVRGGDGDDTLVGDNGDDRLEGQNGNDQLYGGSGNDILVGGAGTNGLDGGIGADLIIAGSGRDYIDGGEDNAPSNISDSIDIVSYQNSSAGITASLLVGYAVGGDADGDRLFNLEGLIGSSHDDKVFGSAAADWISGGGGDDTLFGATGDDTLTGGDGNDTLVGEGGADILAGGNGIDWVYYHTAQGPVTVNFQTGVGGLFFDPNGVFFLSERDTYTGIENALGSTFADTLIGNAVTNVLIGNVGADTLTGGADNDYFAYRTLSESTVAAAGRDTITDFSHAEDDKIDLRPIDADGNAANGNTAFTFTPGGVFSGSGHEVIIQAAGAGVYTVLADVNGDKVADMAITVHSTTALVASDFML